MSFLAPKSGDTRSGDPIQGTRVLGAPGMGTPSLGTSSLGTPDFENEDLGLNSRLKAFLRFVSSSSSPDYLLQDAASQMLRPRKKRLRFEN